MGAIAHVKNALLFVAVFTTVNFGLCWRNVCLAAATDDPGLATEGGSNAIDAKRDLTSVPDARPIRGSIVHDSSELSMAISKATGGEYIYLAPGKYSEILLMGKLFNTPLTITSLNWEKPAVIVGLKIYQSAGIHLSHLDLSAVGDSDPYYPFRMTDVSQIAMTSLNIHGDPAELPENQKRGMLIVSSNHVLIEGSKFYSQWSGLTINESDDVKILESHFYDLDKGAIELGGTSDVVINGNTFSDFKVGRGTHADVVQFYTVGTRISARNIYISQNCYYRGSGDAAQGIFIQDEIGNLPFKDINILDNILIGGMWNAIYVKNVEGVLNIKDNIVATWPGLDKAGPGNLKAMESSPQITPFKAMIFVRGDNTNALITQTGNKAQMFMGAAGKQVSPPLGNRHIGEVSDSGHSFLREWLSLHPASSCGADRGDNLKH